MQSSMRQAKYKKQMLSEMHNKEKRSHGVSSVGKTENSAHYADCKSKHPKHHIELRFSCIADSLPRIEVSDVRLVARYNHGLDRGCRMPWHWARKYDKVRQPVPDNEILSHRAQAVDVLLEERIRIHEDQHLQWVVEGHSDLWHYWWADHMDYLLDQQHALEAVVVEHCEEDPLADLDETQVAHLGRFWHGLLHDT